MKKIFILLMFLIISVCVLGEENDLYSCLNDETYKQIHDYFPKNKDTLILETVVNETKKIVNLKDDKRTKCNNIIAYLNNSVKYYAVENKKITEIIAGKNASFEKESVINNTELKTVIFNSEIENINEDAFRDNPNIENYHVCLCDFSKEKGFIKSSKEFVRYGDINGVLFTSNGRMLVLYPIGRKDEKYIVPYGVESIGNSAFRNAKNLKEIYIPETVTDIGVEAFIGTNAEIVVKKDTKADYFAYKNGMKIRYIDNYPDTYDILIGYLNKIKLVDPFEKEDIRIYYCLSDKNYEINHKYDSESTDYRVLDRSIIENEKTVNFRDDKNISCKNIFAVLRGTIIDNAINNKNITGIIGTDVDKFEDYSVTENDKLKFININSKIDFIGENAFVNNKNIESYHICKCGFDSIYGYENHIDKYFKNYGDIDGVLYTSDGKKLLFYPIGRKNKEYIIPKGVEYIGNSAFTNAKNLKKVYIPKTVKFIGGDSFSGTDITLSVFKYSAGEDYAIEKGLKYEYVKKEMSDVNLMAAFKKKIFPYYDSKYKMYAFNGYGTGFMNIWEYSMIETGYPFELFVRSLDTVYLIVSLYENKEKVNIFVKSTDGSAEFYFKNGKLFDKYWDNKEGQLREYYNRIYITKKEFDSIKSINDFIYLLKTNMPIDVKHETSAINHNGNYIQTDVYHYVFKTDTGEKVYFDVTYKQNTFEYIDDTFEKHWGEKPKTKNLMIINLE